MREIRIFLASSYELEPDRIRFGDLIRRLNDEYETRDIHLTLTKWEDLPGFYAVEGQQEDYNEYIRNSPIFVALFWKRAGQYTMNELDIARKTPGVTPYIFRRKKDSHFSSIETPPPQHNGIGQPMEEQTTDKELLSKFMQEIQACSPWEYSVFEELEIRFKEQLEHWIAEHDSDDLPVWTSPEASSEIIIYAEDSLIFDLACLGDTIRTLNQHRWGNRHYRVSGEISEEAGQSKIMVCLNFNRIPDQEQILVRQFLRDHGSSDSPLLLMQRLGGTAREELEKWYLDHKQYSANYASTDSLLLRFIQHLLIHWKGDSSARQGMLCLKDVYGEDFTVLDLTGLTAVEDLAAELRNCDSQVAGLMKKYKADVFNPQVKADLNRARRTRAECAVKLDRKIEKYLKQERSLLKNRQNMSRKQYDELMELCQTGRFDLINEKLKPLLPSSDEIELYLNTLQNDINKLSVLQEQQYQLARTAKENEVNIRYTEATYADRIKKAEEWIAYLCLAAVNALSTGEPAETAIGYYEKADSLYACINPDDENRIWDVLRPLADLYAQSYLHELAAETYERCVVQLEKSGGEDNSYVLASLCLETANCCKIISSYDKSLDYARKALDLAPYNWGFSALLLMATVFIVLADYPAAEDASRKALKMVSCPEHFVQWLLTVIFLRGSQRRFHDAWKYCGDLEKSLSSILAGEECRVWQPVSSPSEEKPETVAARWVTLAQRFVSSFSTLTSMQIGFFFSAFQAVVQLMAINGCGDETLRISELLLTLKDEDIAFETVAFYFIRLCRDLSTLEQHELSMDHLSAFVDAAKERMELLPAELLVNLFLTTGNNYCMLGDHEEAEKFYDLAKERYPLLPSLFNFDVFFDIATNLLCLGKPEESLDNLNQAKELLPQYLDFSHWQKSKIYSASGILLVQLERYEEALDDLLPVKAALQENLPHLAEEESEIFRNVCAGIGRAYSEIAEQHEESDPPDKEEIRKCYEVALDAYLTACKVEMPPDELAQLSRFAGNLYRKLGDRQSAVDSYEKSLIILDQIGDKSMAVVEARNAIGHLQFEAGNYPAALENSEIALQLQIQLGMDPQAKSVVANQKFIQLIKEKIAERS